MGRALIAVVVGVGIGFVLWGRKGQGGAGGPGAALAGGVDQVVDVAGDAAARAVAAGQAAYDSIHDDAAKLASRIGPAAAGLRVGGEGACSA